MSPLQHYQAQAYEALLAESKLAAGIGHMPQRGCRITMLSLGEAEVPVEYEYERGQAARLYGEADLCFPAIEPNVSIVGVFIAGKWLDADDVLANCVIDRWTQELLEGEEERQRDDREYRMEEKREVEA